jgi:hypothetical protein
MSRLIYNDRPVIYVSAKIAPDQAEYTLYFYGHSEDGSFVQKLNVRQEDLPEGFFSSDEASRFEMLQALLDQHEALPVLSPESE